MKMRTFWTMVIVTGLVLWFMTKGSESATEISKFGNRMAAIEKAVSGQ